MAYAKHAGLADPSCQLYMLFYYLGPASVAITLRSAKSIKRPKSSNSEYGSIISIGDVAVEEYGTALDDRLWPSYDQMKFASFVAIWDIGAQSMVYAGEKIMFVGVVENALFCHLIICSLNIMFSGNNLAGPTIFAIIYSSVTIWAAIYSRFLLSRKMSRDQWIGVILVVFGLSVTAFDSISEGEHIFAGSILILIGSSLHAITYVLSEMIMLPSSETESTGGLIKFRLEPISVRANCAIQGIVACLAFLVWQFFYTLPRFQTLILDQMNNAGTSAIQAICILLSITIANVLHSVTFFQTLKDFPGGATSAGVLKGLQAVLVFLISSVVLCGRIGGSEMCWSRTKLLSLVVVVCGILFYCKSTTSKSEVKSKVVKAHEPLHRVHVV